MIPRSFFDRPASIVAADLIGAVLTVGDTGGIIVETEAYDGADPASHSFNGATPRNGAMFGPPGHAYVYRSYGIHWCLNFVCEAQGQGAAVLIRALEPTVGLDAMAKRRGTPDPLKLASGPGRLTQALGLDRSFDALALDAPPFRLLHGPCPPLLAIGPRVGITKGVETPWRFGWADSRYASKPFSKSALRVSPDRRLSDT